jgi:hypothetical protein
VGVTTERISHVSLTQFLLDFGLGLMLLMLLTTCVNTIIFVQRPHLCDCDRTVVFFSPPPPPNRRNYPHPQATAAQRPPSLLGSLESHILCGIASISISSSFNRPSKPKATSSNYSLLIYCRVGATTLSAWLLPQSHNRSKTSPDLSFSETIETRLSCGAPA